MLEYAYLCRLHAAGITSFKVQMQTDIVNTVGEGSLVSVSGEPHARPGFLSLVNPGLCFMCSAELIRFGESTRAASGLIYSE